MNGSKSYDEDGDLDIDFLNINWNKETFMYMTSSYLISCENSTNLL